ncbi:2585_t:CDS:1 [Cetraspora pellucida]|uniref:2585_t:CDS:1 n=1 Tax=Cetraspora pellucida TaxID=1433469 RepID=A0A9N9HW97_9GLOM|nr:2585_t:CDS:1 [Cetraspora pellucida]
MDENARKKYCGLLMFDVPTPSFSKSNRTSSSQLTIDSTSSLENSSIRTQDKFIFTSFLEPMKVNPQPSKNKPTKNNQVIKVPLHQKKRIQRPLNSFLLYKRSKQPEKITCQHGDVINAEMSGIHANFLQKEPEERKFHWQNSTDKKQENSMVTYPEYYYYPKLSNFSDHKVEVTDSNQFRNMLLGTQTNDNMYALSTEYITMEHTDMSIPWAYDHFEQPNYSVLPSIFPKDDPKDDSSQSHIDTITSIPYPY